MAGEAKTQNFMLSAATVMVGAVADLYNLNPTAHGLGLVKNFQIESQPSYTELTQGIKNDVVFSVMTGNPVRCSFEAYEFSAKNLKYALGLDGAGLTTDGSSYPLATTTAVDDTTLVVTGDAHSTAANKWVVIQPSGDTTGLVIVKKISTASYSSPSTTLTIADSGTVGSIIASGANVTVVHDMDVGSTTTQPFFSAKVVGQLPASGAAITLLMPKIRISRGFSMAFQTGNFGALPFEFTPHDLTSSDTHYGNFDGPVKLLASKVT